MTVAELIKNLQTFPQDLPIVVEGYEWGVGRIPPESVSVVSIAKEIKDSRPLQYLPSIQAVCFFRKFIEEDEDSYGAAFEVSYGEIHK